MDRALYTEPEFAALECAERMTRGTGAIEAGLLARLHAHYSEGEIVEIALVVGLFNYFNRVNNALDVEETAPSPFLD
jgi:alkylhydroperoxidase family enzyme